jgi:secreted protein with Ig-like and vWFA domain
VREEAFEGDELRDRVGNRPRFHGSVEEAANAGGTPAGESARRRGARGGEADRRSTPAGGEEPAGE